MPEAVWFSSPRQVEIRDEARQRLAPGDVRVETIVSGISAGSELLVYRGEAPSDLEPDLPTIGGDFGLPVKFGYASVGRITEVGDAVSGRAVGDLVFVHHPHQTEYVVPAAATIRLPDGAPPDIGVFTANLETAATIVLDAHPRLGESVLVAGQGIVGLLVTMLLRRVGARPIITVDLHAPRRAASTRAGADRTLSPDDSIGAIVRDLSGGRGADLAIDVSGSAAGLQACIDSVAFGGTVVAASWYGARDVTLALGDAFHRRRVKLLSTQVSTLDPALGERWDRSRRTRLVADLLCDLPLAALVTHRFPLREAASAYELLDRSPGECLQVVLDHV